jgi:hypothetical protein
MKNGVIQIVRVTAAIGALFLLGGAVPWPDAVATHVRDMAAECAQVHGQFVENPTIEHGSLDAGPDYWVLDEAGAQCKGAETLFSNQGGSQVTVYVPRDNGQPEQVFESGSYGMTIEHTGDRSTIWITVGGMLCGQSGEPVFADIINCDRSLKWDAASKTLKLAPLSEARFSHPSPAQAAVEKFDYGFGAELTNPRTYVFEAYWRDQARLIDWKKPVRDRGAVYNFPFRSADGRALVVSLLQSPFACDPLCPARVFTAQHRKIMEFMACNALDQHGITKDRLSFIACGQSFPIPQVSAHAAVLENAPPGSDAEAYAEVVRYQSSKPANSPAPSHVDAAFHNGSQVLVSEWKNGTVEITYDSPRAGLAVAPGSLLFKGVRDGNAYSGTAYTFKAGCSPAPFAVAGMKYPNKELIVLTGDAPHRAGRSCDLADGPPRAGGTKLVFDTKFYGDE